MFDLLFNALRSARFQVSVILFSLVYIGALQVYQFKKEFYAEPIRTAPKVDPVVKKLATNIDVGLHINNFPKFSFIKNDFLMDAIVWFRFPVGTESLNTVENFGFQNGEIKQISKPIIKIMGEDAVVSYQVRVKFKTNLDYKFFPVGDHRLTIILDNRTVTPNELAFNVSENDFELSDNLMVTSWVPSRKRVEAGFIQSDLNKGNSQMNITYPIAIFTVDFHNNSPRDLFTLFFPLFVIFFIGFFSLMVDIREAGRMGMSSSSMPILVLYRLVIDSLSPKVATMTKIDFIYFSLVFLSLIILLFQAYVMLRKKGMQHDTKKSQDAQIAVLDKMNSITYVVVISSLIILVTYNGLLM